VLALNSLYWIYIFIQGFWANCACPGKQNVPWIHCIKIFFIIQDFWATWACPEKQRCPEFFHCIEIVFIIYDFWATWACPEKQSVHWIHCIEYIFFIIQDFWATLTRALKTEFALKIFKPGGLLRCPPPRTSMSAASFGSCNCSDTLMSMFYSPELTQGLISLQLWTAVS